MSRENRPCRAVFDILKARRGRRGTRREFSLPLFVATGQCTRRNACRTIPVAEPPVSARKNKQNKPFKLHGLWKHASFARSRSMTDTRTAFAVRLALVRWLFVVLTIIKAQSWSLWLKTKRSPFFIFSFLFVHNNFGANLKSSTWKGSNPNSSPFWINFPLTTQSLLRKLSYTIFRSN